MAKQKCVICHFEKIGRFGASYKVKDLRKKAPPEVIALIPTELADKDLVCLECKDAFGKAKKKPELAVNLQESLKAVREQAVVVQEQNIEKEEMKTEVKEQYQDLLNRVPEYKPKWNKSGVIQFKNERIAILHRVYGRQVEFIIAFDDLTRDGYRLMAQDEGKEGHAGITSGGVDSYYYFQKIEYVSYRDSS